MLRVTVAVLLTVALLSGALAVDNRAVEEAAERGMVQPSSADGVSSGEPVSSGGEDGKESSLETGAKDELLSAEPKPLIDAKSLVQDGTHTETVDIASNPAVSGVEAALQKVIRTYHDAACNKEVQEKARGLMESMLSDFRGSIKCKLHRTPLEESASVSVSVPTEEKPVDVAASLASRLANRGPPPAVLKSIQQAAGEDQGGSSESSDAAASLESKLMRRGPPPAFLRSIQKAGGGEGDSTQESLESKLRNRGRPAFLKAIEGGGAPPAPPPPAPTLGDNTAKAPVVIKEPDEPVEGTFFRNAPSGPDFLTREADGSVNVAEWKSKSFSYPQFSTADHMVCWNDMKKNDEQFQEFARNSNAYADEVLSNYYKTTDRTESWRKFVNSYVKQAKKKKTSSGSKKASAKKVPVYKDPLYLAVMKDLVLNKRVPLESDKGSVGSYKELFPTPTSDARAIQNWIMKLQSINKDYPIIAGLDHPEIFNKEGIVKVQQGQDPKEVKAQLAAYFADYIKSIAAGDRAFHVNMKDGVPIGTGQFAQERIDIWVAFLKPLINDLELADRTMGSRSSELARGATFADPDGFMVNLNYMNYKSLYEHFAKIRAEDPKAPLVYEMESQFDGGDCGQPEDKREVLMNPDHTYGVKSRVCRFDVEIQPDPLDEALYQLMTMDASEQDSSESQVDSPAPATPDSSDIDDSALVPGSGDEPPQPETGSSVALLQMGTGMPKRDVFTFVQNVPLVLASFTDVNNVVQSVYDRMPLPSMRMRAMTAVEEDDNLKNLLKLGLVLGNHLMKGKASIFGKMQPNKEANRPDTYYCYNWDKCDTNSNLAYHPTCRLDVNDYSNWKSPVCRLDEKAPTNTQNMIHHMTMMYRATLPDEEKKKCGLLKYMESKDVIDSKGKTSQLVINKMDEGARVILSYLRQPKFFEDAREPSTFDMRKLPAKIESTEELNNAFKDFSEWVTSNNVCDKANVMSRTCQFHQLYQILKEAIAVRDQAVEALNREGHGYGDDAVAGWRDQYTQRMDSKPTEEVNMIDVMIGFGDAVEVYCREGLALENAIESRNKAASAEASKKTKESGALRKETPHRGDRGARPRPNLKDQILASGQASAEKHRKLYEETKGTGPQDGRDTSADVEDSSEIETGLELMEQM